MSYPPRHPMTMGGLPPMPPGMIPGGYFQPMAPMIPMSMMPSPIIPPGIPLPPMPDARQMPTNPRVMMPNRRPATIIRKPQVYSDDRKLQPERGPTITVFVGNITDRATDAMVKQILQKCGIVVNWKRVQGASGKLQAFGFCEYADPESGLRAIRLLHDWEIGDKKLVVKVDAKTKAELDEYKAAKLKKRQEVVGNRNADNKGGGATPTEEESNSNEADAEEEIDEETQREDKVVRAGIDAILREHEYELSRPLQGGDEVNTSDTKKKLTKAQEAMLKLSGQDDEQQPKEPKNNLDEMDIEEDKKNLIHREIDKFRDTMKKQEEEKEKERERRERERERQKDRHRSDRDHDRDRDRGRGSRTPERNRDWTFERSRSRYPRERDRERQRSDRERDREREREREGDREREREREHSRERSWDKDYSREKNDKDRDREEEEEAYERRKFERKLREKEAAYQERIRNWEARERKKAKEYVKYREKEEERRIEESKEAKRLKEFLEDYDDERDDPKYYKGSALTRRLKEREKEIEADNRDRQREKEELEELRKKLTEEGHPDPNGEVERIQRESEEKYKPKVKAETAEREERQMQPEEEKRKPPSPQAPPNVEEIKISSTSSTINISKKVPDDENTQNSLSGFSDIMTPKEEAKNQPLGFPGLKLGGSPQQMVGVSKRKKLTVGDVFNTDEDDSSDTQPRKRKLIPLDYSEDEKKPEKPSQEEKKKHIKNLIDKIPTEKEKLFAYLIDWTLVDNSLMEKRIRPWINKKIVEYIGEEEPTLVDFICSKLMAGSMPQNILDDVQMVLDDEAEVFVVKMWRLLIYEIEAKKLGLGK